MNDRGPAPDPREGGPVWFPAEAKIRDTATGQVRTYAKWEPEEEDGWSDFNWRENNYSCDCNRASFFAEAVGAVLSDEETPCGDGRYVVESILDARDGREIYSERPE